MTGPTFHRAPSCSHSPLRSRRPVNSLPAARASACLCVDIRARRRGGASLRAVATALGSAKLAFVGPCMRASEQEAGGLGSQRRGTGGHPRGHARSGTPPRSDSLLITNRDRHALTVDPRAAERIPTAHKKPTGRFRPGCRAQVTRPVGPGRPDQADHQHHRIAASNTATALASVIRAHTSHPRAGAEAHQAVRQALPARGDIDPGRAVLTVRLDPLPAGPATAAIAELRIAHLHPNPACRQRPRPTLCKAHPPLPPPAPVRGRVCMK